MNDDNDKHEETAQEEESSGPLAGERLAEARREQQIPVTEIAKELHLDEYKVRALERNDFDVIGAPVFAKGHLRKYAQLVKVNEADLMADYYQLNRSLGAPPVISNRTKPRPVVALGPWVAAIVVIIVVAAAYWWFANHETGAASPVTGEVAPLPQETGATDAQRVDLGGSADDAERALPPASLQPETPVDEPALDVAVPNSGDMQLSISYSGDCWTEITDASGRRLYFELGKAGRTVRLAGKAPFNVLFGDAANVSLVVDGRPFEIPAANRRGRTARLTITGS